MLIALFPFRIYMFKSLLESGISFIKAHEGDRVVVVFVEAMVWKESACAKACAAHAAARALQCVRTVER